LKRFYKQTLESNKNSNKKDTTIKERGHKMYSINDYVLVKENKEDSRHEFAGFVIDVRDQYYQVRDADDDVWDVKEDEIIGTM